TRRIGECDAGVNAAQLCGPRRDPLDGDLPSRTTFWMAASEDSTILCLRSSMRNLSALCVRSTSWSPRNLGAYSAQSSNLSERRPTYPKAARDMVRPPAGEDRYLAAACGRTPCWPLAGPGDCGLSIEVRGSSVTIRAR